MTQAVETETVREPLTVRALLEAGVHIGHPTKRWHPRMEPYIYTKRGGVHILNPRLTLEALEIGADVNISDQVRTTLHFELDNERFTKRPRICRNDSAVKVSRHKSILAGG